MTGQWRSQISAWANGAATFGEPVSAADIRDAEQALGAPLPADLVELLRECDGVEGEYGLGLVWPLARIVADNLLFRSDETFGRPYMPFEPLLFSPMPATATNSPSSCANANATCSPGTTKTTAGPGSLPALPPISDGGWTGDSRCDIERSFSCKKRVAVFR
jgi:SMI1 / KNR4 family (SUKH-1)